MLAERRVGYLAEVRYRPPLHADEISGFMADVRRLVEEADSPVVFCTDWRDIEAFPPGLADTIVWIMRRDNPGIQANAVVVSDDQPQFYREVNGILREANNSNRRVFDDLSAATSWLAQWLSPAEQQRCREFLGTGG